MKVGLFRKPLLAGLGLVALILGGLWIGQGLNLIQGSTMTGDPKWFVIGSILALLGVLLMFLGFGGSHRDPNGPPGQH